MSTALTILIVIASIILGVFLITYLGMLYMAYKFKKRAEDMFFNKGKDILNDTVDPHVSKFQKRLNEKLNYKNLRD